MITFEQADSADGAEGPVSKLHSERVNETRYVRIFTSEEVRDLLLKQVLNEALVSEWSYKRNTSKIDVVSKDEAGNMTVRVVTPE